MAQKKQKNWYYILVLTNDGPVFVTKLGEGKTAFWNCEEAPMEFSKTNAEEIAFGLACNFHVAYAVCTKYEITNQPYFYSKGHFEWVWDEKKGEKNNEG